MPSTVAFTILLIPVHDDGEKMNILRAWHFKSCDINFFMTIIHLPVFADEFYFVFARCATSHWSLLLPVALFACLSFSPCDNLDFPPSVNRFAINLKGFFASTRIDSMILHEKVRKKLFTTVNTLTANGAIAGSFWRDYWNLQMLRSFDGFDAITWERFCWLNKAKANKMQIHFKSKGNLKIFKAGIGKWWFWCCRMGNVEVVDEAIFLNFNAVIRN